MIDPELAGVKIEKPTEEPKKRARRRRAEVKADEQFVESVDPIEEVEMDIEE